MRLRSYPKRWTRRYCGGQTKTCVFGFALLPVEIVLTGLSAELRIVPGQEPGAISAGVPLTCDPPPTDGDVDATVSVVPSETH
ncbi:hypothetical protein GCM10023317_52970 [Actinopolymorpha pittospori]